ncbi:pleckstrin homology domain-containing family H member 1-like isoform X2 [Dysidea avara]|uniref:pleckstrin homology domain-containing family H member 1-like isoform X2 n=1 Tax=Dysidea avara TaxID=196820 RepID=UPI003326D6FE
MAGPGGEETYIHMRPASTVENSSFFPNGEEPSSPGQPADHPTDHLREVLPGHKTPLEVLVSISVIMRNYTNECMNEKDCLNAIKVQLNELVRSWAGVPLTGLSEEISSIVGDINQSEHKYLTIHDSGLSSSSIHTASVSSLHKDSSPLVPPRSKQSLQSSIVLHKSSCPSASVTKPENDDNRRRQTIGATMSTPSRDSPGPSIREKHPIRPKQCRRSYYVSSPSVERRPSLPVKSASISEKHERRSSSTVLVRSTTSYNPPEIVFESSRYGTTRGRCRSQSTSQSTHPPLPPRHRHSLSPSAATVYQRYFKPVLGELSEEEETYDKVEPLAYISPKSLIKRSDHDSSAPSQRDVEGLPVLANIQAKLLKRNSTLKRKRRPIIRKKRSLNESDDGDSESDNVPQQNNASCRRQSSYNPNRRASLTKPVKLHRKTVGCFDSSSRIDVVLLTETKSINVVSIPVQSSEGENEVSKVDVLNKPLVPPALRKSTGKNVDAVNNPVSDGDNEASAVDPFNKSLIPPNIKALLKSPDTDVSTDSDQEFFVFPYDSITERIYSGADIGLGPQDSYHMLMGSISCINRENGKVTKEGYLFKYSNGRHWTKRWFELQGSLLLCYKSKLRRPKVTVALNKWCKLRCIEGEQQYCFTLETTNCCCRLKASSQLDMDNWLVAFQKVLLAAESPYATVKRSSSIHRRKETISSHLYLVECELVCYRWASLEGHCLNFHTNKASMPYTRVDMKNVSLTQISKLPTISGGEVTAEKIKELTHNQSNLLIMQIKRSNSNDLHFILEGKDNQLAWQHHLIQACQQISGLHMTNTERLICQLIEHKEPYDSTLWNHPTLLTNTNVITASLTSLPCTDDSVVALRLNENLLLYCSTEMMPTALDYHIVLVQNMIKKCLEYPSIQNEFYCQIIRQTQCVGDSSGREIKAWQLLSFIIPIFLPRQWYYEYLQSHVSRHSSLSKIPEVIDAAKHCQQILHRTEQNGLRENTPSKFEKIDFDSCTLVHEVLTKVRDEKRVSPESHFTITASWFDDDETSPLEKYLFPAQKLCDVISEWSDVIQGHNTNKASQPVFTYKNRLFFKRRRTRLTNKEITLLCHQFQQDVCQNKFPAARETYIKLAGLHAQMVCGDLKCHVEDIDTTIKNLLLQCLPTKITSHLLKHTVDVMCIELKEQWKRLDKHTPLQCAMEHLKIGWEWPHFGSKIFHTQLLHTATCVWLAVSEEGITVLSDDKLETVQFFSYNNILSFGQQEKCFKLVVTQSSGAYYAETLLYIMSQLMIEEINSLTASYLEHFLQDDSDNEETGSNN